VTRLDGWLLWLAALIVGVIVGLVARKVTAQEKPAREMRQWQVGYLPPGEDDKEEAQRRVPATRVDVFDTEGVCLYVTRIYMASQDWQVNTVAVPKTQLPKGTGCQ
jgi:hypothetical protein